MTLVDHYVAVLQQGFVPIYVADALDAVLLTEAAVAAGAVAVEITCRRPTVREDIRRVRRAFPGLTLLVGSLVDQGPLFDHLRRHRPVMPAIPEVVDMGVDGLVSAMPMSQGTIARYADRCLVMPGVETVQEAVRAIEAGAHFAKFYTACASGEDKRVRAVTAAPLHALLPVFVTGGVSWSKISAYVEAGTALLGSGWDVILGERYAEAQAAPNPAELTASLRRFLDENHRARAACRSPLLGASSTALLAALPFYHPFVSEEAAASAATHR